MKLKLEHLSPYLPNKLKIKTNYSDILKTMNTGLGSSLSWVGIKKCLDSQFKPLLYPIDQLLKIKVGPGETVLANLIWEVSKKDEDEFYTYGTVPESWQSAIDLLKHNPLDMHYGEIVYLLKYHVDIFGLIDAGLALDKSKLEPPQI